MVERNTKKYHEFMLRQSTNDVSLVSHRTMAFITRECKQKLIDHDHVRNHIPINKINILVVLSVCS